MKANDKETELNEEDEGNEENKNELEESEEESIHKARA